MGGEEPVLRGKGASLRQEVQRQIQTVAIDDHTLKLLQTELSGQSSPARLGGAPRRPIHGLSTRKASAGEELP